jgi:hypothetical protein
MEQAELFRDEAIERVTQNSGAWMDNAIACVSRLPNGFKYTGEDIRLMLTHEIDEPHHHNAWGALIRHAVRKQLLTPTGKWQKMRTPRSHARQTPIYRVGI